MTNYVLNLSKMKTALNDKSAQYYLPINDENNNYPLMNDWLGKTIRIEYLGEINCVYCNRLSKKSFGQGYCYPCFRKLAQCDLCLMKPETCHYHLGTCREPKWGETHCFIDHIIYLANTGDVKVGITRLTNTPHRWIDQGATEVLPIMATKNRLISGLVEVALKSHIGDKTNWRKMLQGKPESKPLNMIKESILNSAKDELENIKRANGEDAFFVKDDEHFEIDYPVLAYPQKIKSFNLDKTNLFSGELIGIKGQYLILDTGVINLRKFTGYKVKLNISN